MACECLKFRTVAYDSTPFHSDVWALFAADVDTDTLAEVPSGTTAPLAFSCVQAYGAQGPKLRASASSSVTSVSRSCANR
jgi:hypothetical protein